MQFHPKLSNNQGSFERNTNSQHLLKTYQRLHGYKEEEPSILNKEPSKVSVERYKSAAAQKLDYKLQSHP